MSDDTDNQGELTQDEIDAIEAEWHEGNSPELEDFLFAPVS